MLLVTYNLTKAPGVFICDVSVSKNRVTLVVLLYFASISLVNTGLRSEYRL